jgi:hypothetical protein
MFVGDLFGEDSGDRSVGSNGHCQRHRCPTNSEMLNQRLLSGIVGSSGDHNGLFMTLGDAGFNNAQHFATGGVIFLREHDEREFAFAAGSLERLLQPAQ